MSELRERGSVWEAKHAGDSISGFFPQFGSSISCDVCVIGGGITGVTLAYQLAKEGVDVVLLEGDQIGAGTTGASTAHIDPLTDSYLSDLTQKYGENTVRKIIDSNYEALSFIERVVKEYAIDCAFKKVKGSYLAETHEEFRRLENELETALKLGLFPQFEVAPENPYPCEGRLVFDELAQMDPLQYVFELAKAAKRLGARVFQKSRVEDIEDELVKTGKGSITANNIVMATHTPIGFHPVLQSKVFPYRSYVIGARVKEEIEDGLFWDMKDPYHYLRKTSDSKGELLLVGGADHRTGEMGRDPFGALQAWLKKKYQVESIDYAWSSQLYVPADDLPYIGRASEDSNLWFATGYNGNGITFGTVAASILCDLIQDRPNPYERIYDPQRFNISVSGKSLLKGNYTTAKDFILDRLDRPEEGLESVKAGEGKIVRHKGELVACYKDLSGNLHTMSPVCTHAKCHVRWNEFETSWDCPCHGGRYKATGENICGPPLENLRSIDLAEEEDEIKKGPETGPEPEARI